MSKDYAKLALEMHEINKGKVSVESKVEIKTKDDLSTAYTPGVAEPCLKYMKIKMMFIDTLLKGI
ncbi:malic enzyme, N-terminal domain protein [Clostridioides difficile F665]|nr:malic enzyme, N-terminal domain protein [Clostridioides difficile]ERM50057.1 malic enzyme, N-terminal domain protein [Clostridioides difficile F665]